MKSKYTKKTSLIISSFKRRLLLVINSVLLLFLLVWPIVHDSDACEEEEVKIYTPLPIQNKEENSLNVSENEYLQKALSQDELNKENLFQIENLIYQGTDDMPMEPIQTWEKKVDYINETDLPAELIYNFYEEKLPENIIEPQSTSISHPKINGIKIDLSRKPPYFGKKPVIAIVVDDMGVSHKRTAQISSLEYPLTSSFLTYATNLKAQIYKAKEAGHEIMAHLPMEPKASINVSPDVLTTSMSMEDVETQLGQMLDKFDALCGVNNHMGSRFTEDDKRMNVVMQKLAQKNLFFLDSKTTAHSVAQEAAKKNNVRYVSRNVFLDNEDKFDYIIRQLQKTEIIARKKGYAVAIGHPKEQTFKALKVWLPTLKSRGIRLVPLSEIVDGLYN